MSNPLPQPTASTDEAARRRAASLIGRVISQRYRIDEVIAMGGMGAVYRGEHVRMRKRVAIKILHPDTEGLPELVTRFEREAVAGAHIQHPNVATATDFGETEDGLFYLILEYVRGITLHDLIRRGPVAPARAAHIARQLAAALDAAHAMEIVHRDVKPRNVMVIEPQGDLVKLIDFGFAKVKLGRLSAVAAQAGLDETPAEPEQRLTGAGVVFGTVAYLAPEAAFGMEAVDGRSDLYALGLMFYEMLAGKHPFTATDPVALFTQQCTLKPPPIAERAPGVEVPPELEAVMQRLCAKRQDARYQTAAEVVDALDEACAAAGLALPSPVSASTRPPPVTSAKVPSMPAPPAVPKLDLEPEAEPTPAPAPPAVAPAPEASGVREVEGEAAKAERKPAEEGEKELPGAENEPRDEQEAGPAKVPEAEGEREAGPAKVPEAGGEREAGPAKVPEARGEREVGPAKVPEAEGEREAGPAKEPEARGEREVGPAREPEARGEREAGPAKEPEARGEREVGPAKEPEARGEEIGADREERAAAGPEETPEPAEPAAAAEPAEPAAPRPKRKRKRSERKEKSADRAAAASAEAAEAAEAADAPPASERSSEEVSRPALAPEPLPLKKTAATAAAASAPRRGIGTTLAIAAVVAGAGFLFLNRSSAPPEPVPVAAPAPPRTAAAPPSAAPTGDTMPASTATTAADAPPAPSAAPSADPSDPSAAPSAEPAPGPDAQNREMLSVAVKRRKWPLAVDALLALADHDPTALDDRQLAAAARELAAFISSGGNEARADKVFEALGSKFGSAGPDVLYKLVEGRGRSAPALRAADLLRTPEVAARATPATRIAFELRDAPCDKKLTLLDRAVDDGDARALLVLDTIVKACFTQSHQVDEASKKLKDRLKKK